MIRGPTLVIVCAAVLCSTESTALSYNVRASSPKANVDFLSHRPSDIFLSHQNPSKTMEIAAERIYSKWKRVQRLRQDLFGPTAMPAPKVISAQRIVEPISSTTKRNFSAPPEGCAYKWWWLTGAMRPPLPNIGVYLLNLDTSQDRLAEFKTRWKHGFTRISAVDGKASANTSYFTDFPCLAPGQNGGSKALLLSNVLAMRKALEDGVEWALIFEDDAQPPPDLLDTISCEVDAHPPPDVIWLDNRNQAGDGFIPGCCLSGMLYSRSAMLKLVKDLYWPTSELMQRYRDDSFFPKKRVQSPNCLNDWALANIVAHRGIKAASIKAVGSGAFHTTISLLHRSVNVSVAPAAM